MAASVATRPAGMPGASSEVVDRYDSAGEYYDEDDDFYFDSGADESSDGEVDWDPDRERLLRTLRAQGGLTPGASHRSFASDAATPSKSLNERRNEWRARKGLGRQKTVQELIAEKRAQRQLFGAGAPGAAAAAANPTAHPPAAAIDLSAASLVLDPAAQSSVRGNSPAATATDDSLSSSRSRGGGDTSRRKSLLGWAWGRK